MGKDFRDYLDNWQTWWYGFLPRWAYLKQQAKQRSILGVGQALWLMLIYHAIDVFVNTLTGGDPRESISIRVFRARNINMIYHLLNKVANAIFHDDGPSELPSNGELELSIPGQIFCCWLFVVMPITLWVMTS